MAIFFIFLPFSVGLQQIAYSVQRFWEAILNVPGPLYIGANAISRCSSTSSPANRHPLPDSICAKMAKGSLKKTAQQNATARRNLVLGTGLTQVIHLLLLCFVWSARWSFGQKTLYTLSTALEGFLVVSLLGMSKPTRNSSGQVVSAGEDLSQTGQSLDIICEKILR